MKHIPWILLAVAGLAIFGLLTMNPLDTKVGIIDMGRIIEESPRAEALNRELSERYDELVAEIQAEDIDDEQQAERERVAYSRYLRFRQELEDQFQAEVDEAVAQVAAGRRIAVVLDEDVIRFGGIDISQDIIDRLQ